MASRQLLQSCCRGANDASSSLSTRRVLDPPPLWANARVKSSRRRARGCLPRGRARLEVRSPIVTQPSSASPPVLSHIRRASSPFCLFSSQPPPPLPRRIRLLSSSLSSTPSKSARPAWRRPRLARCTVSRPPTHPPSLLSGQPLTAPPPLPPSQSTSSSPSPRPRAPPLLARVPRSKSSRTPRPRVAQSGGGPALSVRSSALCAPTGEPSFIVRLFSAATRGEAWEKENEWVEKRNESAGKEGGREGDERASSREEYPPFPPPLGRGPPHLPSICMSGLSCSHAGSTPRPHLRAQSRDKKRVKGGWGCILRVGPLAQGFARREGLPACFVASWLASHSNELPHSEATEQKSFS